jgi:hypothetical protein
MITHDSGYASSAGKLQRTISRLNKIWPWIVLVLFLMGAKILCFGDTAKFLGMCHAADDNKDAALLHGYCEGYVQAVQAMSGTKGDDGVCPGTTDVKDVYYSTIWRLDALVQQSPKAAAMPPVDTVSAVLTNLYPCGSGLTTKPPKEKR